MPPQTDKPPYPLAEDDLRSVLDPLPVPREVKAQAWDEFHAASDQQDFQSRFDKLNLPREAKADLWDIRFQGGLLKGPKSIGELYKPNEQAAALHGEEAARAGETYLAPPPKFFDTTAIPRSPFTNQLIIPRATPEQVRSMDAAEDAERARQDDLRYRATVLSAMRKRTVTPQDVEREDAQSEEFQKKWMTGSEKMPVPFFYRYQPTAAPGVSPLWKFPVGVKFTTVGYVQQAAKDLLDNPAIPKGRGEAFAIGYTADFVRAMNDMFLSKVGIASTVLGASEAAALSRSTRSAVAAARLAQDYSAMEEAGATASELFGVRTKMQRAMQSAVQAQQFATAARVTGIGAGAGFGMQGTVSVVDGINRGDYGKVLSGLGQVLLGGAAVAGVASAGGPLEQIRAQTAREVGEQLAGEEVSARRTVQVPPEIQRPPGLPSEVEPPPVTPEQRAAAAATGAVVPGAGAEIEGAAPQVLRGLRHERVLATEAAETARQQGLPPVELPTTHPLSPRFAVAISDERGATEDRTAADRLAQQERLSGIARAQLQKRPSEAEPVILEKGQPDPDPRIVRVAEPNIDEWLSRPLTAQEEFQSEVAQARQEIQQRRTQNALTILRVMIEEERQRQADFQKLADAAEREEERLAHERGIPDYQVRDLRRIQPGALTPQRVQADASTQRLDELKRLLEQAHEEAERIPREGGFRFIGRRGEPEAPPTAIAAPPTETEVKPTPQRTVSAGAGETISSEEAARAEVFVKYSKSGQPTYLGKSPDASLKSGEAILGVNPQTGAVRVQNSNGLSDDEALSKFGQHARENYVSGARAAEQPEFYDLTDESSKRTISDLPLYREMVGPMAYQADSGPMNEGTAADVVSIEQENEGSRISVPDDILDALASHPAQAVRWVTTSADVAKGYSERPSDMVLGPNTVVIASDERGSYLVFDPGMAESEGRLSTAEEQRRAVPEPPALQEPSVKAPPATGPEEEARRIVEQAGFEYVGYQPLFGTAPDRVNFKVGNTTVSVPATKLSVEAVRDRAERLRRDTGERKPTGEMIAARAPGTTSTESPRPDAAEVPFAWGDKAVSETTRGTRVDTQYAVVPAESVGTSFVPETFAPNADYPQQLQPRDRSRFASRDQFNQLVTPGPGQMNFERMADSFNAGDGAPIVGSDLHAETRNMGTTALKWLYAQNSTIAQAYRDALLGNLSRFGLQEQQKFASEISHPVLVRVRRTKMSMDERSRFAAEANEPAQAAKSAVEQAREDAQLITPAVMGTLVPTETGELFTAANADFVRAFFGDVISPADRGRYMRPDGSISSDGITRIRNAVFARAYPGAEDVLAALAEDVSGNMRNVVSGMVAAAPRFAILRDAIDRGLVHNLDISTDLGEAARKMSYLRSTGRYVEDYLNQQGMFGPDISPTALEALRLFNEYSRSARGIRDVLSTYAETAMRIGSTQQLGLLGPSEPPSKQGLLRGVMVEVGGPSLFAEKPPEAVQPPPTPEPGDAGPIAPPPVAEAAPPVRIPTSREGLTAAIDDLVAIGRDRMNAATPDMRGLHPAEVDWLSEQERAHLEELQTALVPFTQAERAGAKARVQKKRAERTRKGEAEVTPPPPPSGVEAKPGFWRLYTWVSDVGIAHVRDFRSSWTKHYGQTQIRNVSDSEEPVLLIDDKGKVIAQSQTWGDTGGRAQALHAGEPMVAGDPGADARQDYAAGRYRPFSDRDNQAEYYSSYADSLSKESNRDALSMVVDDDSMPDSLRQVASDRLAEITRALRIEPPPIQPLMTAEGAIAPGGDIRRAWQVAGASLYKERGGAVVLKELAQNAFDALRPIDPTVDPARAERYQRWKSEQANPSVSILIDPNKNQFSVSDNGIGMTMDEIGTAFTDLAAEAKSGVVGRSGEFGLAKAAIFMIPQMLHVESVAYDPTRGAKTRTTFTATPEDFLEGRVKPNVEELKEPSAIGRMVRSSPQTGTTVTITVPQIDWRTTQAADAVLKSMYPPGNVEVRYFPGGPTRNAETLNRSVGAFEVPGANIELRTSDAQEPSPYHVIPIEVNNNGIYQFSESLMIDPADAAFGFPQRIAADVRATVPAGHPDYPFTANREQLRQELSDLIRQNVDALVLAPQRMAIRDFIAQKYANMPAIQTGFAPAPIYDSGARLTEQDIEKLQKSPAMVEVTEGLQRAAQLIMERAAEIPVSEIGKQFEGRPLSSGIMRVGLLFSGENIHGLHVPNPARPRGSREASIFVNPFNFALTTSPRGPVYRRPHEVDSYEAASAAFEFLKHEILHDLFPHGEQFEYAMAVLGKHLGREGRIWDIIGMLRSGYDPGNTGTVRPELARPMDIYLESRRRPQREKDVLGGQALAGREELSARPDEARPTGGVQTGGRRGLRQHPGSTMGAGDARAVKPPVERYQWLRNSEGRQSSGNRTAIYELSEPLFEKFIKPKLRAGYAANLVEYQAKHPEDKFISLTQVAGEGPLVFTGSGSLEDLRPKPSQIKWTKRVSSFDSQDAKQWAALSDKEVYHAEAAERGEGPYARTRIQAPPGPREVAEPRPAAREGREIRGGAAGRPTGRGTGLEGVKPVRLDPQPPRRVAPIRDLEEWKTSLRSADLPENLPPPTQTVAPDILRKMKFEGQPEAVEAMLSELLDGSGGFLLAASTGAGKTYDASAVAAELQRRGLLNYGLILSPNWTMAQKWMDVLAEFGVMADFMPEGTAPPEKGIFLTTFDTARSRARFDPKTGDIEEGAFADFPWDLLIADEAHRGRKWQLSGRGKILKRAGQKSARVIYASATPIHSLVEMGYLEKLGLWKTQGFDHWIKQFPGVHVGDDGYYEGGNNPRMLAKLRMQLIDRGQMLTLPRNYAGYTVNFGVVPLSAAQRADVRNIGRAFDFAIRFFETGRQFGLAKTARAHAVTYRKAYLDRAKLQPTIELAKKALSQGYSVHLVSATRSAVPEIYNFLKKADDALGGRISAIMPPLEDVVSGINGAFGEQHVANFSGPDTPGRAAELKAFQEGKKKILYTTYDAGSEGVDMDDKVGDSPRVSVFMGPPWSAFQLDQGTGRTWRYGTKSNTQAIILTTDSVPEFKTVVAKVAPRLQSLDAAVRGFDSSNPIVKGFSDMDAFLAFDQGLGEKFDSGDYETVVPDSSAISNYSAIQLPDAKEMHNKGIQVRERTNISPLTRYAKGTQLGGFAGVPDPELVVAELARLKNKVKKLFERKDLQPPPGREDRRDSEMQEAMGPDAQAVIATVAPTDTDRETLGSVVGEIAGMMTEAVDLGDDHGPEFFSSLRSSMDGFRNDPGGPTGPPEETAVAGTPPDEPPKKRFVGLGRSGIAAFIMHGREIIRRRGGEYGDTISNEMIPRYHILEENINGPWSLRFHDILAQRAPSRDEFVNAWYSVEGREQPMNAKAAALARDIAKLDNEIGDRLQEEGVSIEEIDKDSGRRTYVPFRKLQNHMPHIFNPEVYNIGSLRYKEAVERTMKRFGVNRAEAERRVRMRAERIVPLAGNVERHRNRDIDGYEVTVGAYLNYVEQAAEAIARTRIFGQRREKLTALISLIPDRSDRQIVLDIMDQLLSRNHLTHEIRNLTSFVYGYTILTKMFTSAFRHMAGWARIAMLTNNRAFFAGLKDDFVNHKQAKRDAQESGVLLRGIKARMLEEWGVRSRREEDTGGPSTQREALKTLLKGHGAAEVWLEAIGYMSVDRSARLLSDTAARRFLNGTALPKLIKNPNHDFYRRFLREKYQFTDEQIDSAIRRGFWTREDLSQGGAALSDLTQFTYDPTETPPAFRAAGKKYPEQAAGAYMRMMFMLKSIVFKIGYMLKDALILEAKKGNFRPWIPFLTVAPIIGEVLLDLMQLVKGDPERFKQLTDGETYEPWNLLTRYADDITFGVGHNLVTMIVEQLNRGMRISEMVVPPVVADAADLLETVYRSAEDTINGDPDLGLTRFWNFLKRRGPLERTVLEGAESAGGDDQEGVPDISPPPNQVVSPPPVQF